MINHKSDHNKLYINLWYGNKKVLTHKNSNYNFDTHMQQMCKETKPGKCTSTICMQYYIFKKLICKDWNNYSLL
jgi:hypothetical protein